MKCPRCEWVALPAEEGGPVHAQLEQHVVDVGHPVCVCCGRILVVGEEQSCEDRVGETGRGCIQQGRELLAGILTATVDLHGEHRVFPRTAMLGPGGSGQMPRRLNRLEQTMAEQWWLSGRVGPLTRIDWQRMEAARAGKEHLIDNRPEDPAAIAYELEQFEDDWRHVQGVPAAHGGGPRALREAARFLETQMRWAGRHHPEFALFLEELTQLHARCEAAVGRAPVRPEQLDVACLDCGTLLQHPLVEVMEEKDGRRWSGPAIDKQARVCPRCGSRYDDEDGGPSIRWKSAQAEAASRRASLVLDGEVWQQVTRVAHDLGRHRQTVWAWIRAGELRSFEERGLVFVHVEEATTLHRERPVRVRKQEAS